MGEFDYSIKNNRMIVHIGSSNLELPMRLVAFGDCMYCKHFNNKLKTKNVCKAFPDGVPNEILLGEIKHTKPYKGDHGIQFEPISKDKKQKG